MRCWARVACQAKVNSTSSVAGWPNVEGDRVPEMTAPPRSRHAFWHTWSQAFRFNCPQDRGHGFVRAAHHTLGGRFPNFGLISACKNETVSPELSHLLTSSNRGPFERVFRTGYYRENFPRVASPDRSPIYHPFSYTFMPPVVSL